MARTITEILHEITQRAATYPELDEMEQNDSVVQIWRVAKQVMALGMAQVDQSIDALKLEIDDKINSDEQGGVQWYREQILAYQQGYALAIIDNRPRYLTIDTSARIVKHVSVTEPATGGLEIKVAGNDETTIVPLTTDQLAGVKAYLTQVKFAGTAFTIVSNAPNVVDYTVTAEIDKSVLNAVKVRRAIIKAIENFHNSLEFNGTLYVSKVTDVLQKIEGIIDVEIIRARILIDNVRTVFARKYNPPSGYVKLDKEVLEVTIEE